METNHQILTPNISVKKTSLNSATLFHTNPSKSDINFWIIMVGIIIIIAMLITVIVLFTTGNMNCQIQAPEVGQICSVTSDCSTGLQCNNGICSIPALASCSNFPNYCVNGVSCNNGICGSEKPIEPIVPIKPSQDSDNCILAKQLLSDEEALNNFNLTLIQNKEQFKEELCNPEYNPYIQT